MFQLEIHILYAVNYHARQNELRSTAKWYMYISWSTEEAAWGSWVGKDSGTRNTWTEALKGRRPLTKGKSQWKVDSKTREHCSLKDVKMGKLEKFWTIQYAQFRVYRQEAGWGQRGKDHTFNSEELHIHYIDNIKNVEEHYSILMEVKSSLWTNVGCCICRT